MEQIPLAKFVEKFGQTEAGNKLGVSQGAIWQMLKNRRNIFVTEVSPGEFEAKEIKPIGRAADSAA